MLLNYESNEPTPSPAKQRFRRRAARSDLLPCGAPRGQDGGLLMERINRTIVRTRQAPVRSRSVPPQFSPIFSHFTRPSKQLGFNHLETCASSNGTAAPPNGRCSRGSGMQHGGSLPRLPWNRGHEPCSIGKNAMAATTGPERLRHDQLLASTICTALSRARALLTVSSYSDEGMESATMPAPACTCA
jgi:hypothetical protein